jgi:histidinol-phosphatase (PHP family)
MDGKSQRTLPPDYHTHTRLCKHAEGEPGDYVRAAQANGVARVACTDHCPTDVRFGIEHRMELHEFPLYRAWVTETDALFGIEADFYRGCEDFLRSMEDEHPFDLVLGSVHFLDYWAKRGLSNGNPDAIWREYFSLIGEMADTGLFDIATHLDLPKKFGNPISEDRLREHALPALDKIAAAGMALEINTSGLRHPCREMYPSLPLLTWARERGIGLTFGSDAHAPARVGADFDKAVAHAAAAGFRQLRRYARRKHVEEPIRQPAGVRPGNGAAN